MSTTQSPVTSSSPDARSRPIGHAPARMRAFAEAQQQVLDRYDVPAAVRFVDVPAIGGQAQVLEAGDGPPLVMVVGGTIPAVMWAPLMAELGDYHVYAMDLPGFGLTDPVPYAAASYRSTATRFLAEVLDGLGLASAHFVTNSTGSLWTMWLALEQPQRVRAEVQIGCPAHVLGTSAPAPMRVMSIGPIGRLLMRAMPPSRAQVERVGRGVGEDLAAVPELRDALLACERLPAYQESVLRLMHTHMRWGIPRREVVLRERDLAGVQHPIQLIWGEDDPFGPVAVGRRIAAALPDARFEVVPGGHGVWFRQAPRVGSLVRHFFAGGGVDSG